MRRSLASSPHHQIPNKIAATKGWPVIWKEREADCKSLRNGFANNGATSKEISERVRTHIML